MKHIGLVQNVMHSEQRCCFSINAFYALYLEIWHFPSSKKKIKSADHIGILV